MPTRNEVSKLKADWINKRNQTIQRKLTEMEAELFDNIIEELGLLKKKERLSQADLNRIEMKIRRAMREKFPEVMRETVRAATSLGDLNLMYYSTLMESDQLEEIRRKTERNVNRSLGLNEDGSIKQNGFVDRMLASDVVQKKFIREVKKQMSANADYQTLQMRLKEQFTTGRGQNGLISKHYNTFAKDLVINVDRSSSAVYAKELGLKSAYYEGGLIKTSRSFCMQKNGKIFHMDQISKWKDSTFIRDMYEDKIDEYDPINGPPGGYGCLHVLGWITDDLAAGKAEQNRVAAERNRKFKERYDL